MQNQHLMNALDEFFLSSYPISSPVTPANDGVSSIGYTGIVTTSDSSGNFLIKFIVVSGVILLIYYITNNYYKVYKKDHTNKRF